MSKRNKKRGKTAAVTSTTNTPASPAGVSTTPAVVTQAGVTATQPRAPAPPHGPSLTRRSLTYGFLAALLVAGGLYAAYLAGVWPFAAAPDKVLYESWQVAYLDGHKIGHGHLLSVRTQNKEGKQVIRTTHDLELVMKRYGSVMPIRQEQSCEETPDGKVLSLESTFTIGTNKQGPFRGVVNGNQLSFTSPDSPRPRLLDFPDDVVGFYFQETYFTRHELKPGDTFSLRSFELQIESSHPYHGTVKQAEQTDRLVLKKQGDSAQIVREPARLTRVDLQGKAMVKGIEVPLPDKTTWLDDERMPVREVFQMEGLGTITLYRTTKDAALKEKVDPELLPDLELKVSIPLARPIENPYDTREAVYLVTTKEPLDKAFASDNRQTIRDVKEKSFQLIVKADREPGRNHGVTPGKEYLESNAFVGSDDERVVALTKEAVGDEKDAWAKACKIEKWVHNRMRVATDVGFPNAAQIARDLTGDCRQHALLLAAMCRAAGVPSRTAVGLVYVQSDGKPTFGFHMWAEVWVGGKWVALDAIFGKGGIGATHLKMADHSWADTVTLAPLLPIAPTLGKLRIEVVRAK